MKEPPVAEPNYTVLNIRLTDEQLDAVDRIAFARGQSRSATIRWLLADAIAHFFSGAWPTSEPSGELVSKNGATE